MRLAKFTFLALGAIAFTGAAAHGETLIGSTGAGYLPFPTMLTQNGTMAFWDDPSIDGSMKNIGYFLTGTGGWAPGLDPLSSQSPHLTAPQWWSSGGTSTGADLSQIFQHDSTTQYQITVILGNTSQLNTLGYYDAGGAPGVPLTTHQLFTAGEFTTGLNTVLPFSPGNFYGFYLSTPQGGGNTFYSEARYNASAADEQNHQHFVVFQDTTASVQTFYIGVEDGVGKNNFQDGGEGYGDFNDLVFKLSAISNSQTPEPAAYILVGAGLASIGLLRRRRRA